jgi:hypothetical protein
LKVDSIELPVFLEIRDKDKVGGMQVELQKSFETEDEKQDKQESEEEKKTVDEKLQETEEKLSLTPETTSGVEIIESINFSTALSDKNSPFQYFDKKDKVFRVAVILELFEREYSFLLTGTKVKYYMEHHEGLKFDPKKDLNEAYVEINSVQDSIREYAQQVKESVETESNSNIPAMQKHNLIHKFTIQKTKISMGVRAKLGNTLQKLMKTLEKIRGNYSMFLAEPNLKLYFNDTDGRKRLEGRSNKDAIEEFYCFISGFYYLVTKGVLGGAGNVVR